ncbi:AraC family transcriptional regulator [uncultured Litoreibacter sp.]|uniref:AraC family transcriptional regulator n=1 Tax=uncultured Litoreibacter sp. TaxID=1392394 RepID=UPI00260C4341|nr:AraC family transcriptional regulator [uncultured Litoreibacter sp.]
MQRYHVAHSAKQLCDIAGVRKEAVMARAGLPANLDKEARGVTPREYFAFWSAVVVESGRDDFSMFVGCMPSGVPHNSETAAFALSPDVRTGLERLAVFKPLLCPTRATVEATPAGIRFNLYSADPSHPMPMDFQALHPIFITELIRACTGVHVVPLQVGFDGPELAQPSVATYFGFAPQQMPYVTLLISHEDAALPLLSNNAEKWGWLEPSFRARLEAMYGGQTIRERVAGVLIEMLPAGLSGIEVASDRLNMSKRSLQRMLKADGLTYQRILTDTRRDLALGYLRMPQLTIDEISHLLAYRETNSFYRAFQGWTGMTPQQARSV